MPGPKRHGHPEPMTLATLITSARGHRSYQDLANRSRGQLTKGRWQQLATQPRQKRMPAPPTMTVIAEALGVPLSAVVLAAARSIGLDVDSPTPGLADRLPPNLDELLSERQADALVAFVRGWVLPDPDEPDAGNE